MFWQSNVGIIAGRGALDAPSAVAPVNSVLPVISGIAQVGSTLSTTNGTWTGSPTYSYQWKRGGVNISGATANTYLLVSADLATTVTVTVTATNAGGNANATSTGVVIGAACATFNGTATDMTLSNGNLTVTRNTTAISASGARSASFKTTGKYYFEITYGASHGGSDGFGLLLSSGTFTNQINGQNCINVFNSFGPGNIYANNAAAGVTLGVTLVAGSVVCFAIDLDNQKAWARVNGGNWNNSGTANPATNTGGIGLTFAPAAYAPSIAFGNTGSITGDNATGNFGQYTFGFPVPSGFGNWPAGGGGLYATLNLNGPNVTLSNGDLTATRSVTATTATGARSVVEKSTGKYYFEFTRGASGGSSDGLGVTIYSAILADMGNGQNCGTMFTNFGPGNIYSSNASQGSIPGSPVVGDVIGVAVDLTAHLIWFRKNGGNWNNSGTANPATGTGGFALASGSFVPAITFSNTGSTAGNTTTANFGQTSYANAAPSGFGNWPAS